MAENKRLSKTKVWENISEEVAKLLEESKVSKKFSAELMHILETNLKPKSGGGSSEHPPKLDEDGNIVEAYCRYHQRYYPVDKMVMSNDKSKGYSKAAIAKWNRAQREVKAMEAKAIEAMNKGNFKEAQALSKEATELKANSLKPEFYDPEQDWVDFKAK